VSLRLPDSQYEELCQQVLKRDHYRCKSCGSRNQLHIHHVIYRSHQGPDKSWNLCTVCSACHDGIHVDVKNGVFGLVIRWLDAQPNADDPHGICFVRNWGWMPH
jgi:5-methylcytosine-specific restriction endonuclease McrA